MLRLWVSNEQLQLVQANNSQSRSRSMSTQKQVQCIIIICNIFNACLIPQTIAINNTTVLMSANSNVHNKFKR